MLSKYKLPLMGVGIIIACLISDQLSKWAILEHVLKPELNLEPLGFIAWLGSTARLPFISMELTSFFNLSMVWNQGISFGLFQSGNPWPLIIVALIISGVFSFWLYRTQSKVEAVCLSMVIGGALGNIIDRLHLGAVADFFDFHIIGWHYPAFNLADSYISIGIVMLVIYSLFFAPKDQIQE